MPLGVSIGKAGIQFAIALPNEMECRLKLFGNNEGEETTLILGEEYRWGSIFSVVFDDLPYELSEYVYEVKGKEMLDPYARIITGREEWGNADCKPRCKIIFEEFDWGHDKPLCIPYSDMILYQLHVRGFTMHASSKVKHRGTYQGIIEKIPYLKQLGITGIIVMPTYEFDEIMRNDARGAAEKHFLNYKNTDTSLLDKDVADYKVNYWGYAKDCNYFAPKTSYAANLSNPANELKELVKTLHENQIEFHMEMSFQKGTNQVMILECLRHWVLEYHVDGFRINQDVVPTNLIANDPVLSSVKLMATSWNINDIYEETFIPDYKRLAEYNDGFLADARRFLKSDEEQVEKFLYRMKKNHPKNGVVNYITTINGFTLMDLVSYDIKHNEANEESGRDGTDYNYSWNCGVEGKSKKKAVIALRRKQIRNAFLMLLLSQGTPMILSGDEFGNSNEGNNNAYCQDNEISWLNWNQLKTHKDIYAYVKNLIQLRKNHKILHMKDEFRAMDYISCGYPDFSIHGTKAWYPDFSNYSRVLGIMLCGKYAIIDRKHHDDYFYFAINMHWEPHEYDLPKLPGSMKWSILLDTTVSTVEVNELKNQKTFLVSPRSIMVFIGK